MVVLKVGTYVDIIGGHATGGWGIITEVIMGKQMLYRVGGRNIGEEAMVFRRDQLQVIKRKKGDVGTEFTLGSILVGATKNLAGTPESAGQAAGGVVGSLVELSSETTNCVEQTTGEKTMRVTKRGQSKNGKATFYEGAGAPLRFQNNVFVDNTPPDTIDFAEGIFKAPRAPKVKLTPEERKAARAAKPKPTAAEKLAKLEEKAAKLRAEAAAEGTL